MVEVKKYIFEKVHYMKELSSQFLLVEYTILQILDGKALKNKQSRERMGTKILIKIKMLENQLEYKTHIQTNTAKL